MNKPIRTLAVFCMLLFVALLVNATYLQYWQADDLNERTRDNKRVRDAEFSRERGAILVGAATPVAESSRVRRRVQVPARLPAAAEVRPPHRLLLLRLRPHRRRAHPELHPVRQRPAAVRQPGHRPGRQRASRRAAASR